MISSREEFIQYFASLQKEFEAVEKSAQKRGGESQREIECIMSASAGSVLQQTRLKISHPLYKTVEAMAATLRNEADKWKRDIDAYEKSAGFRGKYPNALMVYVYGKVKSGKSSMLNYLAHGCTDPTPQQIAQNVEVFFQDDSGKYNAQEEELLATRRMKVAYTEATSAIQGYALPGITLVDSPGIHSMSPENGALAQEYLQSADIILYATSSQSSARASDIKELLEIIKAQKTYFIISTAADEIEQDEDDAGNIVEQLVMMSLKDQRDLREYCVTQLLAENEGVLPDAESLRQRALSISALYAERNANADGWKQSGMEALSTSICKMAKSEGVRIKQQTPLKNLYSYNTKLLYSLDTLDNALTSNRDWVAKVKKEIAELKEREVDRVSLLLPEAIEGLKECAKGKDKEFARAVQEIGGRCLEEADLNIVSQFMDSVKAQMDDGGRYGMFSVELPSVEDVYKEIAYPSSQKKRWGGILGTLAVGLVGLATGGVGAAVMGAALGGVAGARIGKEFDGTASGMVCVGDNSADVRRATIEKLEAAIAEQLSATEEHLNTACIDPLVQWMDALQCSVDALRSILAAQQEEINKEIAQ